MRLPTEPALAEDAQTLRSEVWGMAGVSGHRVGREGWNGNFLLSGRGVGNGETGIERLWGCDSVWNGSLFFLWGVRA